MQRSRVLQNLEKVMRLEFAILGKIGAVHRVANFIEPQTLRGWS